MTGKRIWGGLAMAIALASMTAGGVVIAQDDPPVGDGLANLWISEDGGPCTYSATPVEWNTATDCDTFDEAYDVIRAATGASCGGTVLVKAGSYPEEEVTGFRDNCPTTADGMTLFAPEDFDCDLEEYPTEDTDVVITGGSLSPGDAENSGQAAAIGHVIFCGITMENSNVTNNNASGSATDISRYGPFIRGSRYVTYQRTIFGGFSIFMTGYDAYDNTTGHISFLFNSIGPCHEYSNTCGGNGKVDIAENILIEGNYFHDYRSLSNCTEGGAVDCGHWEPMFINGTTNLTVRRNRFFNYEQSGAVYTTCSGPDISAVAGICHENLLVENNWFESPSNTDQGGQDPGDGGERGEAVIGPGHCEGFGGTDLNNIVIRNNTVVGQSGEILLSSGSFTPGANPCSVGAGGVHITGNIANRITSFEGCSAPGLTMDYNIGTIYSSNGSNPCGANRHNSTLATSIMNNSTWGNVSQDMHLLSTSTIASGFVPEALCPDEDYDGDARPSGACDAGADER